MECRPARRAGADRALDASVFRGGWDLAAAENVLGSDVADRLEALLAHAEAAVVELERTGGELGLEAAAREALAWANG